MSTEHYYAIKMHIKDYHLPNPANTEHHHAVRTNIKDYQLLIKDNKATLPTTVLPSQITNSHNSTKLS